MASCLYPGQKAYGANSFLKELTRFRKEAKKENGRVSVPEIVQEFSSYFKV